MVQDLPAIPTAQEMVVEMQRAWSDLRAVVDAATPDELVEKTDAAGWSAKDHLAHLDAWDTSVLVMIRDGRPQWEGLGIDQAMYDEEGYDHKNEVIRQHSVAAPLDEVRASLASTHNEFVRVLEGMTDEQLHRPANDYVPGSGDFEIAHKIMGNTYMHYDEHREYIERILAS